MFPKEIQNLIAEYVVPPVWKFTSWVPPDTQIDYNVLARNPKVIDLIEANLDKLWNWDDLSVHPGAMHLLLKNPHKTNWQELSANPSAVDHLREYPERIDWCCLSSNPAAIDIIEKNLDKISWQSLSTNPAAMHILKTEPKKIWMEHLSINPAGVDYLIEHGYLDCETLARNHNPKAIELVKPFLDKLPGMWSSLSANPTAVELLKANPDKIDKRQISANPEAFELDRDAFKANISALTKWFP